MKPISLHREDSKGNNLNKLSLNSLILLGYLCFTVKPLTAQVYFEQTAPEKYRIEFTDKLNSPYSVDVPGEFLSQKALERRQRQGIAVTMNDLPVNPAYIDSIVAAGAKVLNLSKWFNSVTIHTTDPAILTKISKLSFVKKDFPVHASRNPETGINRSGSGVKQTGSSYELEYGSSWWQTGVHNGHILHNKGFTGKGITIAVIDAGFYNADVIPVFDHLRENGQILGTRDFVTAGADVYRGQSHGMAVLSIIGGYKTGELVGTAPDADFWLLRSEDGGSEYLIEEDNWIAAAEFADSAGTDIINSSLGYSDFDDPVQNHTYADMDGNTTRVSRAADLAVSKGMLVVVSAGNEGGQLWKYITAPADADSALTVGAVDQTRYVAVFSSRGPSADGQVKPDIMAIGKGTYISNPDGSIRQGNGTSFSAPVIAGLSACLWQSDRNASVMELHAAIRESADRFTQPDGDYGNGIPDFNLADILLKADADGEPFAEQVTVFPNPFNNQLYLVFKSPVDVPVDITLYDLAGKELFRRTFPGITGRNYVKIEGEFGNLPKGAYFIKVDAGAVTGNSKLIRF